MALDKISQRLKEGHQMYADYHVTAVLAAGGSGSRLGEPLGKQLLSVAGKPVAAWALQGMVDSAAIDDVVIVCSPSRVSEYEHILRSHVSTDKPLKFVEGSDTRVESVRNGLNACESADIVVVHDGARPLVQPSTVDGVVQYVVEHPGYSGAVVGHPSIDTLKIVRDRVVEATPPRDQYWVAQTPQVFWYQRFLQAYEHYDSYGFAATDDASLLEHAGFMVAMYEGPRDNIKVTVPEDIAFVNERLRGNL